MQSINSVRSELNYASNNNKKNENHVLGLNHLQANGV